jgi:microcystin-dependent protein
MGLAKIAQAIADAENAPQPPQQISAMVFGDGNGNPVTPSQTQFQLVRQVYSTPLNRLERVDGNSRYIAEGIIPFDEGGWTIREVGLLDADGELFAAASFPDVYKPTIGEGATRDLVVRLVFEVSNAAEVELVVDPSLVVATRSWVEGNFELSALLPGGTTGQVLRKRSNTDGDVEWFDPLSGLNLIVDIVQEQQTLAASQTTVNLSTATTVGAAIYVEGIRLHPGDFSITSSTQIVLSSSYPAGSKILIVQNDPGGELRYLQASLNLSDVGSKQTSRANLGFPDAPDGGFLAELWKSLMAFQFPVGEIYMTRRTGNPTLWLGFGTWERYGAGRTLVSLDPLDASFSTLDQTGGSKTHVLTLNEMPVHSHVADPPQTTTALAGAHSHGLWSVTAQTGTGDKNYSLTSANTSVAGDQFAGSSARGFVATNGSGQQLVSTEGSHTHVIDIAPFTTGNAGGGQAHNNLQPYIVVNVWRRTA